MEAKEAIAEIRKNLAAVKTLGHSTIPIDGLENYLAVLEKSADVSIELRKLQQQGILAQYAKEAEAALKMFETVIEAGKEALNVIILINGGAVVALLSFLSKGQDPIGERLAASLLLFGCGVLLGALGFGFRYLCAFFYARARRARARVTGHIFNGLTWLLAILSYCAFGCGVYVTYNAFLQFFKH